MYILLHGIKNIEGKGDRKMIVAIIIISLALAWLAYETKGLTIRLESTEYQRLVNTPVKVNHTPESKENTGPYKPAEFIPEVLPEYIGKLKIICERG